MSNIGFGVIGMGRMGRLHARNLQGMIRGARLVGVTVAPADVPAVRAETPRITVFESVEDMLADPHVEAVVIASPSRVHDRHIALSAAANKAIFCEKPLSDSVERAEAAARAVEDSGVPFQIGFQRRFDPGYVRARELIGEGRIGRPELFRGISSDHMPPVSYLRTSGGLFWDLGVHDFDAARFLMNDEVLAVHAAGAVLIEPALNEFGDIDYGIVTLRFRSGGLGVVQNSWRAPWGYEIRAEVCGSEGRVTTEVDERVPVRLYLAEGFVSERFHQFLDRFSEAYRLELQAFVDAVLRRCAPQPNALDGLRAIRIADAATRSHRESRWVEVTSALQGVEGA